MSKIQGIHWPLSIMSNNKVNGKLWRPNKLRTTKNSDVSDMKVKNRD